MLAVVAVVVRMEGLLVLVVLEVVPMAQPQALM
jgi:hypothetical protein